MSAGNAYTTAEGLVPAVQSGALAPLRSSYLKHLVESGEALQKRQDLPEAAFWDVAAFQRLTQSEVGAFSIFALSYRWLTAEHPDPDSFHLSKVVAFLEVLKACVAERSINVDDCAVFWDFGSLFQPERTPDQKALFRECLRASNVWYGSVHTTVLVQSHLPPGFTATPYTQSGWCFVEATINSVIKRSTTRFDMGALELDGAGNLVIDDYETVMQRCMGRRCVPLRPDLVRHLLYIEKKFTTDADKAVVAALYESFFSVRQLFRRLLYTKASLPRFVSSPRLPEGDQGPSEANFPLSAEEATSVLNRAILESVAWD